MFLDCTYQESVRPEYDTTHSSSLLKTTTSGKDLFFNTEGVNHNNQVLKLTIFTKLTETQIFNDSDKFLGIAFCAKISELWFLTTRITRLSKML